MIRDLIYKIKALYRAIQIRFCNNLKFFEESGEEIFLHNIVISDEFEKHPIKSQKMVKKIEFFIDKGVFKEKIIVDENNILVDGYSTYLLAKELKFEKVFVKRMRYYYEKNRR